MQTIIGTAIDLLDNTETFALRLANLEVLINCVLYNPSAALHLMEAHSPGTARSFFDRWFAAINENEISLPRVHDKKLTLIALCALMEMPAATVPESLRDGWPGIITGALNVFKTLPEAIESMCFD